MDGEIIDVTYANICLNNHDDNIPNYIQLEVFEMADYLNELDKEKITDLQQSLRKKDIELQREMFNQQLLVI